jgi:RNA polymerase primary sigma factor
MTDSAAPTLSPWDAVPDAEIQKLIAKGKAKGSLTVDEVMLVIKDVDMGEEVILAVRRLCSDNGIDLDESEDLIEVDVPDDADDEPPSRRPTALEVLDSLQVHDAEDMSSRRARRRQSRIPPTRVSEASRTAGAADPVRMYLKEIGRVPLLTAPEEVELAKRIEAGLHAAEQLADLAAGDELAKLGAVERRDLKRVINDGEDAKSALTEANLRLWCRSPSGTWGGACSSSIWCRRATWASCGRSRSSTTPRASSSLLTPRGGSVRPSRGPSPTRPAPSASRCTWSSRSTRSIGCSVR